MPNWCNNTLELAHKDPAMIDRAEKALNEGTFLNEFIPVPADLSIVAGRVSDENEQALLEAKEKANEEKYGYQNWYDYCVNEWGTKWDVGQEGCQTRSDPNNLISSFDSAWAPPTAAMDKLMDMGFSVRLYYYEPGMAFAGIYGDDGDDYYDIGGLTSETVKDDLPEALDTMFGISECIAEYEAEEAEEDADE